MKPYWAVLSARFRALLQYRSAAAAGFACQMFWGLIRMMIFQAFYENANAQAPMTLDDVVAYVWLGQAFLMLIPFRIDHELQEMIRTGSVAYELLRPLDLYAFWYCRTVANRIAPTVLRAVPLLIVAVLAGWIRRPALASLAACLAALTAALLLSAALCSLMNISMFWTISGQGITMALSPIIYVLSGMIIPLPLFPDALQPLLNALPFRGLCDVPFRLFTGHIPPAEALGVVLHQLAWTAGLILFGRWLLGRAVRRLVVQGG